MRPPQAGSARRSRCRRTTATRAPGFVTLAVTRLPAQDQAHRIGALFVNPGGPGGSAVDFAQGERPDLFGAVQRPLRHRRLRPARHRRELAVDRLQGQPGDAGPLLGAVHDAREPRRQRAAWPRTSAFVKRCVDLNKSILPYVSTANAARDMDGIRAAMGDKKLNYLGFSYGTFLGATYTSLFPDNYRAMVLDGPVDANSYINTPSADLREQTAGFERALGRFFQACAADQAFCKFGGDGSVGGVRRARRPGQHACRSRRRRTADPRPVNGDDILNGTIITLYAKQNWPLLANALSEAAATATPRGCASSPTPLWGNNFDGTFDPGTDRYFTIGAIEQKYPSDVQPFLDAGDNAGACSTTSGSTPATPSSTTGSGRSTPRTRSVARSRPPSRRRRCSRSRRRTTPRRRIAGPSGSRRSSATCAS